MEHSRLTNCALWALCLLVLIAGGCRDGGVSESAEGDAGGIDAQESGMAEFQNSEFCSAESDEGGDLAANQGDGENSFVESEIEVVAEDLEERVRSSQVGSSTEIQAESLAAESGEKQIRDIFTDRYKQTLFVSIPYHFHVWNTDWLRTPAIGFESQTDTVLMHSPWKISI